MSSFDPSKLWGEENHGRHTKDEWNMGISQPVGGLFNLSVSGWQQSCPYPEQDIPLCTVTVKTRPDGNAEYAD